MVVDKAALIASYHTKLQKKVLIWDYNQILKEHNEKNRKRIKSSEVPSSFASVEEYISVFEPLLLEECRTQIANGAAEGEVLDLKTAALTSFKQDMQFCTAKFAVDSSENFNENDIVFLYKQNDRQTSAFGLVESRQIMEVSLRLYLDVPETIKNSKDVNNNLPAVRVALQTTGSGWWLSKLSSLSTIMREYVGLCSLASIPFKDVILSGKLPQNVPLSRQKKVSKELMNYLKETHNLSQLTAIMDALTAKPVVLVQGPPGTGKTQTILGVLSAIMHSTAPSLASEAFMKSRARNEMTDDEIYSHLMKASPWLLGQNRRDLIMPIDGEDGYFPEDLNEFRPVTVGTVTRKHRAHILVCAPSNSALDEIVLRLLKSGVRDEDGKQYVPSIVRVGVNAHHSVQSVTMDNLVEQRLKSIDRSMNKGERIREQQDRIRSIILEEAAIVCSTLSFSGSSVFSRMKRGFHAIVIDEAAQAVEPSTLVPLTYGCKQAFLIGDPKQLPATVLSKKAVSRGYRVSMFERFQKAGYPVQILNTQYRMHPQIREFPSREFYGECLEDGAGVRDETERQWHEHYCFGPFAFFDIDGTENKPSTGSYENVEEAEFVLVLYRHLIALYPELKGGPRVGVISPYKRQVTTLRERFAEVLGEDAARLVDINTVDGFQGREKDVAIFSCVRSNPEQKSDFVSDERRLNVGLTRARSSMLVVGCVAALQQGEHWYNLIEHARQAGRLIKVTKPYHAMFNEASLAAMKAKTVEQDAPMAENGVDQEMADVITQDQQVDANEDGEEYAEDYDDAGYED